MKRVATIWGLNGKPIYRMDSDYGFAFVRTADGMFAPMPQREAGDYWVDVKMLGDRPDDKSAAMFPIVVYAATGEETLFFATCYKNMADTLHQAYQDVLSKVPGATTSEADVRQVIGVLRDRMLSEPTHSHIPRKLRIDCWEFVWMQFYSDLHHGRFKTKEPT